MDKIQIVNLLLTRRCNLRCDYCSIVKDYPGMPEIYPNMKYYKEHELSVNEWIQILSMLKKNNPNIFLIFYGGEPFLYDGLSELIQFCHKENLHYTIISNNTKEIQPKILKLYQDVGQLEGFTASIDPCLYRILHYPKIDYSDDAVKKTLQGYENLLKIKSEKIAKDVVAEITVNNYNQVSLYDTVKVLSEAGIYSSITVIDLKKSPYYDFSTVTDVSMLVQKSYMIKDQFEKIIKDNTLLVHIPSLLPKLYDILPCDMKCGIYEDVHNVTIDSDGTFRLCLRIKGDKVPKASLIFDEDGKIKKEFKDSLTSDYYNFCRGCNWTCALMSAYYRNNILEH